MNHFQYTFLLCFFILQACTIKKKLSDPKKEETKYTLVWADEFETEGRPDSSKWKFERGFVRNQELQWYQAENVFIENGLLVIEAKRDTISNPAYDPRSENWKEERSQAYFSSGSIQTRQTWMYGRFEVRAKIVAEEGLWPAIWTLGRGEVWPTGGEIDIMEYYDDSLLANVAWSGPKQWQAIWNSTKIALNNLGGKDWDQQFHLWRMDWTEDSIQIYLDDRLLNALSLDQSLNKRGNIKNPFREVPQYLLLNLALGGNRGGSTKKTSFPTRYEIDYVRVYQLQ